MKMWRSIGLVCLAAAILWPGGRAEGRGHMRGFSPRGGGGMGMVFGAAMAAVRARAAWEAREAAAEAARRAKNNAQRMTYAEKARKEGKPRLAATLYLRVALAKEKVNKAAAKKALSSMADDGRAEMKKADALLAKGQVIEAFQKLDYLNWAYENVPKFNEEISAHVGKLHRDPQYKAILNEDDASLMLAEAKKYEANDERCCAFLIYEELAKLVPAKSALAGEQRLKELKADPEAVAEAEECRVIRECLHTFHTAELLTKNAPDRAVELFRKIVEQSPNDSEVYKCAREELAKLSSR
ncbi:MAG TPA: hypothetical protein VHB99_12250 [Pirellulales bacterium]|nr:hypothetical protein [Pirellulales bacterium]